jgi:next-to-BRCA1 protein 1
MAAPAPPAPPVGPDTLITIKVIHNNNVTRRFKIPLRDLGARVFPQKIRYLLSVAPTDSLILERYSDSLASYILLESENLAVYKQLYRAAKAKLKLRIKATTKPQEPSDTPATATAVEEPLIQDQSHQRFRYLETVLQPAVESSSAASPTTDNMTSPLPTRPMSHSAVPPTHGEEHIVLPLRSSNNRVGTMFCIDCNNCGSSIPSEHYHCSICDGGDYDLCPACVDAGVSCPGDGHWLLKRAVQNGAIINSVTEVAPKRVSSLETLVAEKQAPVKEEEVAETTPEVEEKAPIVSEPETNEEVETVEDTRCCNACFRELSATSMVHCENCEDYDLCVTCLLKNNHGHDPAHAFAMIKDSQIDLKSLVESRCRPGRHYHHAAICDGCEKRIVGIRHKCLSCPDWDYCWSCIQKADQTHPQHRFVPIYGAISEPSFAQDIHYGIYCDGPLCRGKPFSWYITGVRYKCAVCHDTDFCASCESLPTNTHNRTHPMIKFRTPVRNVTVSTMGDDGFGGKTMVMGDRTPPAVRPPVPDVVEAPVVEAPVVEAPTVVEPPVMEKAVAESQVESAPTPPLISDKSNDGFNAYFMKDTIADGTVMAPCQVFEQTWTLFNPGPSTWPIGTCVRFVSGELMLNFSNSHPTSVADFEKAMTSTELTHPVGPSETADFSITLKSPQRAGTTTSYWRLKLPSGTPFGHKLWCEVKVVDENAF